jgi:hypothetical protein
MTRAHVQTHGEDWLQEFDPSGNWPVPTIQNLSIAGPSPLPEALHALWPAPTLLQVTFSQRLDRSQLERRWNAAEDAQNRGYDDYERFPPRRTGPQLAELEAQVQRSYVWTGVHSIRLIRHDGDNFLDPGSDEFTVQFVRRGEHGDEVIEVPSVDNSPGHDDRLRLTKRERNTLRAQLAATLAMRHRFMPELGNRERPRYFMGGGRPAAFVHPNGEEWSVRTVPAAAGAAT